MTNKHHVHDHRGTNIISRGEVNFPPELATTLTHESGLIGTIMIPLKNLPTLAAHDNPEVRAAGELVADIRADIAAKLRNDRYRCMGCAKNIGNPNRLVAIVLVQLATKQGGTEYHALCKGCGASEVALTRALTVLVPSFGETLAQSPHIHESGGWA